MKPIEVVVVSSSICSLGYLGYRIIKVSMSYSPFQFALSTIASLAIECAVSYLAKPPVKAALSSMTSVLDRFGAKYPSLAEKTVWLFPLGAIYGITLIDRVIYDLTPGWLQIIALSMHCCAIDVFCNSYDWKGATLSNVLSYYSGLNEKFPEVCAAKDRIAETFLGEYKILAIEHSPKIVSIVLARIAYIAGYSPIVLATVGAVASTVSEVAFQHYFFTN